MKKIFSLIFSLSIISLCFAGNPDRQGEAGAYELLMMPWARTAGLNILNASRVGGLEAIRVNPAGLSRMHSNGELIVGHARYFDGTDITMNAVGFSTQSGKVDETLGKKTSAFGISIFTLDFGDIPVTTENAPEGTGGTFRPLFLNIALSYSKNFEDKIFVGFTTRIVSESISELNAFGVALDAGVQYVTGEKDNFTFGVVLRNFGTPMKFSGQGLSFASTIGSNDDPNFEVALNQQGKKFELPSQLSIGVAYDFYLGELNRLSLMGSFIANSFALDQLGLGVEYAFKEMFMLRASYKSDLSDVNIDGFTNVYSGLALGASIEVPFSKEANSAFGIDYAYRSTNPFNGTHNIGIRFLF